MYDLPKLTIKPYENLGRSPLTMNDLDIRIDGQEVKGLRELTVYLDHKEINAVIMDFIVGELEIDLEAIQEIQANIRKMEVE